MARTLCLTMAFAIAAALALSEVEGPALARQSAPKLTKTQRDTLQAIVAEVDRAMETPETPGVTWQTHVLRTSDGAHYVAFTADGADTEPPPAGATMYVRLATRLGATTAFAEKSAVMEWLKGMRSDPLVAKKQRGIAFGEMLGCIQNAAQGYTLDEVLADLTRRLGVPVVTGLPCGHTSGVHRPLPFGLRVTLAADDESPVLRIDESLVV